jgi:hypothetical protein
MVGDVARRINELRFLEGVEKVEHVPYSDRDEFWVRFNRPIDLRRLAKVVSEHHYELVKFGSFPSKLPSKLDGLVWNGVAYVILRQIGFIGLLAAFFGFEPGGVAKIVKDLQSSQPIFITTNEEGVKILYDYIGLEYTPPTPEPTLKTGSPTKPATQSPAKPTPPKPSAAATVQPQTAQPAKTTQMASNQ